MTIAFFSDEVHIHMPCRDSRFVYIPVLVIISSLAGVLGIEGALRAFPSVLDLFDPGYYNNENWFSYDGNANFVLKKNLEKTYSFKYSKDSTREVLIRTNSDGYREQEFSVKKKKRGKRISAIGDSFTESYNVDAMQAWPSLLDEGLGEAANVFNMGVHNYGPAQYYLAARLNAPMVDPDIIIVGFYLLNDVTRYSDFSYIKNQADNGGGWFIERAWNLYKKARVRTLIEQSQPNLSSRGHKKRSSEWKPGCVLPGESNDDLVYRGNYRRYYSNFAWQFLPESAEFKQSIAPTVEYINALLSLNEGRVLVVLFPTREQAVDGWWDSYRCLFDVEDENRLAMRDALIKQVASDRLIDLTPALLKAQNQKTYLQFDGHMDTGGHVVAAEVIGEALKNTGLLTTP